MVVHVRYDTNIPPYDTVHTFTYIHMVVVPYHTTAQKAAMRAFSKHVRPTATRGTTDPEY